MFAVLLARAVKRFYRPAEEDEDVINYNETLVPWLRRFAWLWVKTLRLAVLVYVVALPACSMLGFSYSYGIACFWLIYMPVCGLFFNYYHQTDGGEGPYYINKGVGESGRERPKNFFRRF